MTACRGVALVRANIFPWCAVMLVSLAGVARLDYSIHQLQAIKVGSWAVEIIHETREEFDVLGQVPVTEEVAQNPGMSGRAEPSG